MVEIRGMRELKKAFSDMSKQVVKNQDVALHLSANAYNIDVKAICPIRDDDSGIKGGTLRKSIHVEPKQGIIRDGENRAYVVVGTDLPYARRLEFGFYNGDGFTGGVDSLGRHYNQAPRPYFRPPLDTNFKKYQDIYVGALGIAVR